MLIAADNDPEVKTTESGLLVSIFESGFEGLPSGNNSKWGPLSTWPRWCSRVTLRTSLTGDEMLTVKSAAEGRVSTDPALILLVFLPSIDRLTVQGISPCADMLGSDNVF